MLEINKYYFTADSLAMKYAVKIYDCMTNCGGCVIATFRGDDKQEVLELAYDFITLQDNEDSPYYTVTIENFEDDIIESCYIEI